MATLKLGILAGEASGDNLGAGLMREFRREAHSRGDRVEFIGVGGPAMLAEGLHSLASMETLSVNGFKEPILRLPSLLGLLRSLVRQMQAARVDAFVGIDFNVFNLLLEKALKKRDIKTAHYVSPSVYAWRKGRTKKIARSADLLLCLYPFEPAFYAQTPVEAKFVGHPLADKIAPDAASAEAQRRARAELGAGLEDTVLAVLPGSRKSEVTLMAPQFLRAAKLFAQAQEGRGSVVAVVPCPRPELREILERELRAMRSAPRVIFDAGTATRALLACDIALVKSGTSTLEAMLLHRPMVVSYKLGAATYFLVKRLVSTPFVALPNILAQRELVPELLQEAATGEALAEALVTVYADSAGVSHAPEERQGRPREEWGQTEMFRQLHDQLRKGADTQAALALMELINRKP